MHLTMPPTPILGCFQAMVTLNSSVLIGCSSGGADRRRPVPLPHSD